MDRPSPNPCLPARDQWERLRRLLIGLIANCFLLSIAFYNGYPTIFSDTGSYLWTGAFFKPIHPFRAPGYSVFTRLTSLGVSGWFIVLVQALIVEYVLFKTTDYLIEGSSKLRDYWMLISTACLTVLTSLPWLVSLLMPDVFAGVVFLSAFLLAFNAGLRRGERLMLATILTLAVASHSSLLPIAFVFIAGLIVVTFVRNVAMTVSAKAFVPAWLFVPIVIAGFSTAALNAKMKLGFTLSPARNDFLLARLFGDGLAADFLRENCAKRSFVSCQYLSRLPRTENEFLFENPLLRKIDEREVAAIVRGTLRAYPMRFALDSARNSVTQFVSFRTGDEIRWFSAERWNTNVITRVFPGDFLAYRQDRQIRGRLFSLANSAARLDGVVFWLCLSTSVLFALGRRFGRVNQFLYSAFLFAALNACVCATLSGVFSRYQGRVVWIIPFCLFAYLGNWIFERKRVRQNSPNIVRHRIASA